MKKTKLLTSLAALVLVLSLGACEKTAVDNSSEAGEESTSTENTSGETSQEDSSSNTSIEGNDEIDYAIYGDFVDSSWINEPAKDSKYFIPAGTTHYETSVTISDAPVDNEYWTDDNQWNAGLRVVEYGTWTLAVGSDDLDQASTGVLGVDDEKNIKVEWGATYDLVIDLGETKSILVTKELDHVEDPAGLLERVNEMGNYSITLYDDNWVPNNPITYDEYMSYTQGDEEATLKYNAMFDDVYLQSSVRYDLYYMEDCVLAHKFELIDDEYTKVQTEIIVNDNGTLWDYVSADDLNWDTSSSENKTWQEDHYSLFDAYDYGVGDCFTFLSSEDGIDSYTLEGKPSGKSYDATAYWFAMGGEDFIYGRSNALTNGRYYYTYDGTDFTKTSQQLDTQYHCDWIEVDMSLNMNVKRELVTSSVYDAGITDCSEVCNYCHNFWQAVLNLFE